MSDSSNDEKRSKRYGKVPKIGPADQFIFWKAAFDTYLGDDCMDSIKSVKPSEDVNHVHQIRNNQSRLDTYRKKLKREISKRKKHQRDAQLAPTHSNIEIPNLRAKT